MTPRLAFIPQPERRVPCCECPTIATHIGWDDAPSFLCNTHLEPWMQWRGFTFDYGSVA
ncbi:hypothetical protein LX12_004350 [Williamsia serinedens]|uniref:Uncharacterized protein n=1 Tax=Williamsia serinedens TaxID=391736 RepID=A0ABT1H937_9NOCA|nr:hypothetical protein [Williamsia serinedens]